MKLKFKKDFANNWQTGDIVPLYLIDQETYSIDKVCIITNNDLKHILSEYAELIKEEDDPVIPHSEKYVYVAEIERFGYTLRVIGETEEEAKTALTNEYIRAFKNNNEDMHPKDAICEYDEKRTYYDIFKDEMCVEKAYFGKVEWR